VFEPPAELDERAGVARAAARRAPGDAEAAGRHLRGLVDAAPEAIVVTDAAGRILLVNRQAELLFGYTREELQDQAVEILIPTPHHAVHAQHRRRYTADPYTRPMGVGRALQGRRKDGSTFPVEVSLSPLIAEDTLRVISTIRDVTERQQAEEVLRFLADTSAALVSSLDYQTTLHTVARLAVSRLADWCTIDIIQVDGTTGRAVVAHRDPTKEAMLREVEHIYPAEANPLHAVTMAMSTARTMQLEAVTTARLVAIAQDEEHLRLLRDLAPRAVVTVPLVARGRTLGVITLVSTESPSRYGPTEVALAEDLAQRAALAVDNARLYQEAQDAIGARDRALAAVTAERAHLQQVLDVLPEGVAIVDASGQIVMVNRAVQEITGRDTTGRRLPATDTEEYQNYGIRRLNGGPYPVAEHPLYRSLHHGEVVQGDQHQLRHAVSGRDVPLLVNSAPLRDATGEIVGAVTVFQDITSLKNAERVRDEFLSTVAHDLKNPLTIIGGQLQLARYRLAGSVTGENVSLEGMLSRADDAVRRMTRMIEEISASARLPLGGTLTLRRTPIDLVAHVRGVVTQVQDLGRSSIDVDAAVPALVWTLDADRVARVMENLLSNALKYSPDGGAITVHITREQAADGPEAVITVRDKGLGIPAADLPHIFERFYRADNVARRARGMGIGLAGVRHIVEAHGGTVTVASKEGAGTTVTVRLPHYPS
jgi:PAS domain S-box-containing protein